MKNSLSIKTLADEFFSLSTIAITGLSRRKKDAAEAIYNVLRRSGYNLIPVHHHADEWHGVRCFNRLKDIPGGVEGVIIINKPEITFSICRDAVSAGVKYVWMHRSFGNSVSEDAVNYCRINGLKVIDGGCPLMFTKNADFGHRCLKHIFTWFGRVPEKIEIL